MHRNGETLLSLLSTDGRLALLPLEHAVKVSPSPTVFNSPSSRTLPFNSPSSRNPRPYPSSRRQRSHACSPRTQTISSSHSSCPRQRPMNPNRPSTTIDQLAEQHTFLLADLEVILPQHETTISALRQQFEAHIRFLCINLESYIALQLSIANALQEQQPSSDPVQATAFPIPPAPFDTPHISRQGRFAFCAVRRGRTTGIFNCWADCHRSVNRTSNEYRGFHNIDDALDYINQAPLSS